MTLTYFMARSAEVAFPSSQVSVYRTIGPLVRGYWNFKTSKLAIFGIQIGVWAFIRVWAFHRIFMVFCIFV